ncbi:hypothetical protein IFM89_003049 [Coptis chinensis]|uniref:START domain-containing protein n=1 Tax=Coptis chinensis TaxID=261450 RepID=A0A835IQW9_9MAGN|nr:hypothetical protein IFM89_003049 [Coptis chinensis]
MWVENSRLKEEWDKAHCGNCCQDENRRLFQENIVLQNELERLTTIAGNLEDARRMSSYQHMSSALDLQAARGDADVTGNSSGPDFASIPMYDPRSPVDIGVYEIALLAHIATKAVDELMTLSQNNEQLWCKSSFDGREILDVYNYRRLFPIDDHFKNGNSWVEASRHSGVVMMDGLTLVDMFMDVISQVLQVLSPVVQTRELHFLRFCKEIGQGLWAVVDLSFYAYEENQSSCLKVWKFPSGCVIQDIVNRCSKVTWIEHVEVEGEKDIDYLYKDLIESGIAFGAERWFSSLQSISERLKYLQVNCSATQTP